MTAPTVPTPTTGKRPESTPRTDRHRDEYWDVFTASWRRRSPAVPLPRSGD